MNRLHAPVSIKWLLLLMIVLATSGCLVHPHHDELDVAHEEAEPVLPKQVLFTPLKGQNSHTQDRDRYECYLWARKQSAFDPSSPLPEHQHVVTASPGHDTVSGALHGAIIGSHVTGYRHSGKGALFGAIAGAMIGSASDAHREEEAQAYEHELNEPVRQSIEQAKHYHRAFTTCMDGRGYKVKHP